jgi:pre-rRNA-processing protein TSR3
MEPSRLPGHHGTRRVRKIVLFEYKHNDPKRDSGMKLVRLGLAKSIRPGDAFKGIVLSAEGRCVLSQADLSLIKSAGIGAINCSWNRLDEVTNIPGGNLSRHRKLPFIVASNPINYGKAFKMNSAEALAAGLAIVGLREEAEKLTEKFSWNDEFWRLNGEYLDAYSACKSGKEVLCVQNEFMGNKAPETDDLDESKREGKIRAVTFNDKPEVKEFEKGSSMVPELVTEEKIIEFPKTAPKDQKKCVLFLLDLPICESLGINKHTSGNILGKMKRKDYLSIWEKFIANLDNIQYVEQLELALEKK